MKLLTTILAVALAPSVLAAATFLLPCSAISGTPCRCPDGTVYSESITAALIGATANDVGMITNDFFNVSWQGTPVFSKQGPNNFPLLSVRTINITTSVGVYPVTQRLTFRLIFPDGSFEQKYEQTGPITYRAGNFANFQTRALANATRILTNRGLVHGVSSDPISAENF
ncbi:hypothetical protein GGS20DRAFT_589092 [Poronia punctata]|nr:hypothetical protein GGS20DRAFT_589092 [Poronia punctata]